MGIAYTDDGQVAIPQSSTCGCLLALVVDATVQNFPILCEVYAVFKVVKTTTVLATQAVLLAYL